MTRERRGWVTGEIKFFCAFTCTKINDIYSRYSRGRVAAPGVVCEIRGLRVDVPGWTMAEAGFAGRSDVFFRSSCSGGLWEKYTKEYWNN